MYIQGYMMCLINYQCQSSANIQSLTCNFLLQYMHSGNDNGGQSYSRTCCIHAPVAFTAVFSFATRTTRQNIKNQ